MKPLTKADLADTIAALPDDSYSKAILSDLLPEMQRAIDSDFVFIPFTEIRATMEQDRQDSLKAREELDALRAQIRNLLRERDLLAHGIDVLRDDARKLALIAGVRL